MSKTFSNALNPQLSFTPVGYAYRHQKKGMQQAVQQIDTSIACYRIQDVSEICALIKRLQIESETP
jgi:hypothetical protein